MNVISRIAKHARLNWQSLDSTEVPSPPFVILFINSICNMKCEHCFYWQNLNRRDDLTFEEMVGLSEQLGHIENLNLSGGEPFIRKEFGAICRQFIRQNGVKEIYVPSNGYFTERTIEQIRETLKEKSLRLFAIELSLDGMAEFHDTFRVTKGSFDKAMETYDALVQLQREDPRLQIHSISTATVSLRALSADVTSQPGTDSWRSKESLVTRTKTDRVPTTSGVCATLVGSSRAGEIRQRSGANAAVGQGQNSGGAETGCSV